MTKDKESKHKNPHAVALGKLGGKAKVPKGFAITPRPVLCHSDAPDQNCRRCQKRLAMRRYRQDKN